MEEIKQNFEEDGRESGQEEPLTKVFRVLSGIDNDSSSEGPLK